MRKLAAEFLGTSALRLRRDGVIVFTNCQPSHAGPSSPAAFYNCCFRHTRGLARRRQLAAFKVRHILNKRCSGSAKLASPRFAHS